MTNQVLARPFGSGFDRASAIICSIVMPSKRLAFCFTLVA
jgi:hypothetical protein